MCNLYSMTVAPEAISLSFSEPRDARTQKNRSCNPQREETSLLIGLASTVKVISAAFASLPARLIGDLQL